MLYKYQLNKLTPFLQTVVCCCEKNLIEVYVFYNLFFFILIFHSIFLVICPPLPNSIHQFSFPSFPIIFLFLCTQLVLHHSSPFFSFVSPLTFLSVAYFIYQNPFPLPPLPSSIYLPPLSGFPFFVLYSFTLTACIYQTLSCFSLPFCFTRCKSFFVA